MALKDRNVLTASTGFIYTGTPGLAPPTPEEIEAFDPLTFGCKSYDLVVTDPDFEFTVGAETTPSIPETATPAQVQTAIEALPSVGAGNAQVEAGAQAGEFVLTFQGALQGVDVSPSATGATLTVKNLLNGWSMVGHTSRDEMPEFGQDGGDTEVRGTWQNVALKEVQSETPADYFVVNINQIDRETFSLYYGPESGPAVPGVFKYAGNPSTNEKALLVVIVDGDLKLGFAARKASFRREDAISIAVDNFLYLPTRATFVKHGAHEMYQWISKDLFE